MLLTLKNNGITESEFASIMRNDYLDRPIEDDEYIPSFLDSYSELEFEERSELIDNTEEPSNIIQFPQFNFNFEPKDPAVCMAA